ncbi:MAG TPA: STAS-like domain-containing protein [bacterium]|nr:STAS-like domain-containing protein [bacterium]
MIFSIKKITAGQWVATRDAGKAVREAIIGRWPKGEVIILDFEGLIIASVSFLDEAFGLLVMSLPLCEVKNRLKVKKMDKNDYNLMNQIISSRLKQEAVNLIEIDES